MHTVIPVSADDGTLYQPPADPGLVRVPPFTFVMIDGTGDPATSPGYQAAIGAVYAVSYPVVMTLKQAAAGAEGPAARGAVVGRRPQRVQPRE